MTDLSRRGFIRVTAGVGVGLVIGCRAQAGSPEAPEAEGQALNVFVQIEPSGKVILTVPRPDIGQGVRTSLAMILAEDLGVDWEAVEVRQAPGDRGAFGGQFVGGSGTVRGSYGMLRKVGASAALMLKSAAAAEWGVKPEECTIEKGVVKSGAKSKPIGALAAAAAKIPVPQDPPLKPKEQFTIIGRPTRRVDNRDVVTGKAKFGLDVRVPGMKFASIERPDSFGAQPKTVDDGRCRRVSGVTDVFKTGSGVAVVGTSSWAVLKGRKALEVEWEGGTAVTTEELSKAFAQAVVPFPDMPAGASKTVEAVYELPYLAHATMEPMNCTANVQGDKCEVWAPTQAPDGARGQIARQLNIPEANVTVNATLAGGGFGRRFMNDFIGEAVAISKQVGGPVQLIWTRRDDMKHDYYRPMNYHAMKGAVSGSGEILAYYHQLFEAGRASAGGWDRLRLRYRIPNGGTRSGGIQSPVPTGAWRSVENSYMGFVTECFFDELCEAAGKDPMEARLAMSDDKMKRLLNLVKEKSDWGKALPAGRGRGVACFVGYGSAIAQVAEVEVKGKEIRVVKITAAVDCGLAVNPLSIAAQIEGASMDGVAAALYAGITISEGGAEQSAFRDYKWSRMPDAPHIEVHIVADGDSPGGMGEVGHPASIPAIVNAIKAASGVRHRKLPILG